MRDYMSASLAFLICCAAIWLFADTLWWTNEQKELTEDNALNEATIIVGVSPPCKVSIHLSAWDHMNQMEIYRWVVACEDAQ